MGNHNTIGSQGDRRDTPHQIADTVRELGQKAVAWALMAGTAAFGLVGCSLGKKTTEYKTVSVACGHDSLAVPQIERAETYEYYITGGPRLGVVTVGCPGGGNVIVTGINEPNSNPAPKGELFPHTLEITALCSRGDAGFKTRVIDTPAGNSIFEATIKDCSIESAVINRDPS